MCHRMNRDNLGDAQRSLKETIDILLLHEGKRPRQLSLDVGELFPQITTYDFVWKGAYITARWGSSDLRLRTCVAKSAYSCFPFRLILQHAEINKLFSFHPHILQYGARRLNLSS